MDETEDAKAARWGSPPEHLRLGEDEVHVWRAKLNARAAEVEQLVPVLSRAERREMKRADKPKDYAAGRHLIRTLLSRYLGGDPRKLSLKSAPDGRLVLAQDGAPHFFLDSTSGRALFAISATQRVALAIEEVPSEAEIRQRISAMPSREARQMEFLSPQSRAQAVVGYEVEGRAMERLTAAGGPAESRVERLKVGGSYVAALAAEGWDWSPSFWRYWRAGESGRPDGDDEEAAA